MFLSIFKHSSQRVRPNLIAIELTTVFLAVLFILFAVSNLGGTDANVLKLIGLSLAAAVIHSAIHALLNGYGSWRFFSLNDAIITAFAAVAATVILALFTFSMVPFTGWILVAFAGTIGGLAPRLATRIANSHGLNIGFKGNQDETVEESQQKQTLLMIGFGDHVANFLRAQEQANSQYKVLGVVQINSVLEAASLRGVPVLGSITSLEQIIDRLTKQGKRPDSLVLTRDEMSNRSVGELLALTDKTGIPTAWLPRTDQIDSSKNQQIRSIKLDDLLPRSTNLFDAQACSDMMSDSTILVTGAGGSIGSELVRQIASVNPGRLILTDASEHAIYKIDQEIRRQFSHLDITSLLLDVRDRDAVMRTVKAHRPEFLFHAAALKHVPIVEGQPCEGVITNVIGSQNVADAAAEANARAMVMVSTDKAVNPANVMGATKRMAEAYCQAMDASFANAANKTRYVTVRFGNVLGSNGSVVPLFQKQLQSGGPLTVTHPDVERFFMTIPEASRLILQALLFGISDTKGDQGIFVLDMGKSVKIIDLARQVIRLSGLTPGSDVKIVYTGLRPGEKLYEELMHETEDMVQTEHPSLMVARPRFVQIQTIRSQIEVIRAAAQAGDAEETERLLKVYIPEFAETSAQAAADGAAPIHTSPNKENDNTLESVS